MWGVNFYSSLGLTVFNNFGYYAFLLIMLVSFGRKVEIKPAEALAVMSVLFFLFMSINGLTVYALNTVY